MKPINTSKGEHRIGNFFSNIISNHVLQTRINSKSSEVFGPDIPDSDQMRYELLIEFEKVMSRTKTLTTLVLAILLMIVFVSLYLKR